MTRPFDVRLPLEQGYRREVMLALELLDPVTLEPISQGVTVTAVGLAGTPIVNSGGLFVWLKSARGALQKLVIEPGTRPYERVEIPAAQVNGTLHTAMLSPRADYPFAPGVTAIRGAIYDKVLDGTRQPLSGATIRTEWLHDDKTTWTQAPAVVLTDVNGQFTLVLRLISMQAPLLEKGDMTVRLYVKRAAGGERHKEFPLPLGMVNDKTYAWSELVD